MDAAGGWDRGKADITVEAEIPGGGADDIDVALDRRTLAISVEEKQEEDENVQRVERVDGSFTRLRSPKIRD